MKPSGYWKDVENIKKEIDAFNLAHGVPGWMPKEDNLKARGCSSLALAIQKQGGFPKFALTHGYSTNRRPNRHFNDFGTLKRELLEWTESTGSEGTMPTAQELKEAIPPRHDLLAAIGKHGGFATVAKKSGLRMSHNTKPDGYYNDITNLAREVYAFVDSEGLDGTMPTASQLKDAQQTGLTRAICSHGGFWSVAKTLGLSPNRKHFGYWTPETVDSEVKDYLQSAGIDGVMPTDYELRAAGRADLCVAISRHGGGMVATANRLGLVSRAQKPDGYWDDEGQIARELLEFIQAHGTPGHMPTQAALTQAGRVDLSLAISRAGGGWTKVANGLNLELAQVPKGHWSDLENVKAAILLFNARTGRTGEMPTKTDLDLAGEFSLGAAIEKLGGYPCVAAIFGLSAGRMTLWPRSRDELILAHELKLFVPIDLDDRKVQGFRKSYDADIVVRPWKLIIEYDSHYYHKNQAIQDLRKTTDLQDAGWTVIRVREEPLDHLQPGDVLVRKGRYKETCNRVLLKMTATQNLQANALGKYLKMPDLQNSAACEQLIAQILETKRGKVVLEDSTLPLGGA